MAYAIRTLKCLDVGDSGNARVPSGDVTWRPAVAAVADGRRWVLSLTTAISPSRIITLQNPPLFVPNSSWYCVLRISMTDSM